jgi:hypothetical protein
MVYSETRGRRLILPVMARLGLAIHEFLYGDRDALSKLVDPKAKPWDDE